MSDWSEPDTGWEAFIPMRPDEAARRAERNRRIADEASRRLEEDDG